MWGLEVLWRILRLEGNFVGCVVAKQPFSRQYCLYIIYYSQRLFLLHDEGLPEEWPECILSIYLSKYSESLIWKIFDIQGSAVPLTFSRDHSTLCRSTNLLLFQIVIFLLLPKIYIADRWYKILFRNYCLLSNQMMCIHVFKYYEEAK